MSIFNKIAGYGSINNNIEHQISDYLLDDENVIMAFTFVRDSVVLTNYGIYTLDKTYFSLFSNQKKQSHLIQVHLLNSFVLISFAS